MEVNHNKLRIGSENSKASKTFSEVGISPGESSILTGSGISPSSANHKGPPFPETNFLNQYIPLQSIAEVNTNNRKGILFDYADSKLPDKQGGLRWWNKLFSRTKKINKGNNLTFVDSTNMDSAKNSVNAGNDVFGGNQLSKTIIGGNIPNSPPSDFLSSPNKEYTNGDKNNTIPCRTRKKESRLGLAMGELYRIFVDGVKLSLIIFFFCVASLAGFFYGFTHYLINENTYFHFTVGSLNVSVAKHTRGDSLPGTAYKNNVPIYDELNHIGTAWKYGDYSYLVNNDILDNVNSLFLSDGTELYIYKKSDLLGMSVLVEAGQNIEAIEFSKITPAMGDKVYYCDFAMGLNNSCYSDFIASVGQRMPGTTYDKFLQTQHVPPGKYIFDVDGNFLGMTYVRNAAFSLFCENVSMVIPTDMIERFVNIPLNTFEFPDHALSERDKSVYVAKDVPEYNLNKGDIIKKFEEYDIHNINTLKLIYGLQEPHKNFTFEIIRGNNIKKITFTN